MAGSPSTEKPAQIVATRRRKTLVVCDPCPRQHPCEANRVKHGIVAGEPGDQKWSRRVREGVSEKGHTASPRPYLSRPHRRAVKARSVGVCRGCGAYTQPRNGKGDALALGVSFG